MSTELTQVQLNELKSVFKMFDDNSDGKLSTNEVRETLSKVDYNLNENEIEELIQTLDKNGDGTVEFNEFAKELGKKYAKRNTKDELTAAFKVFDKDGSNSIDDEELFEVIKRFNPSITKQHVDQILSKVDRNNSGKITLDEFIDLMSK